MLSEEAYRKIDREVAKYPPDQKQSAVMSGLRIAQTELGWLSMEAIEHVADYLDMPPIAAYTVGFFFFWTICAIASMISMYLVRTEHPHPPF